MLLEIHAHSSRHSRCSHIDPVRLVRQVAKKKLQGIIITEHHYLWSQEELARLRTDAQIDDLFLVLAGQEVETDSGHVLVLGADRTIPERILLRDLRRTFPDAALVLAHPFRNGTVPKTDDLLNPDLDAVEIFSSNQTTRENYFGLRAWHDHKFCACAGSDTHAEDTAGVLPTLFDHLAGSIADVAAEIRKKRCRPFFKEIPKSGSTIVVTEITIGTKGDDELRPRIILKSIRDERRWNDAETALKIADELYHRGFSDGVFRIPKIIDINETERLIIEEGQRGKSLFDLLISVDPLVGARYFELSARWLARLHNAGLALENREKTLPRELKKLESYRNSFVESGSPYRDKADILIDFVKEEESRVLSAASEGFVQLHGDYHPKNIIIGQDRMQDISTLFISVIDFGNSFLFLPAFDVGYFLSQFLSQFAAFPAVLANYRESDFIKYYRSEATGISSDLSDHTILFKIRANLSIASFFIKVGKGQSEEMAVIFERSLSLKEDYGRHETRPV